MDSFAVIVGDKESRPESPTSVMALTCDDPAASEPDGLTANNAALSKPARSGR